MTPPSTKTGAEALLIDATVLLDEPMTLLLLTVSILDHFHFHCFVANSASMTNSNSLTIIMFFPLMPCHFPLAHSLHPVSTLVASSTHCSRIAVLACSRLFLHAMQAI